MPPVVLWTLLLSAPAAYTLTGLVRAYALRRGILDIPNARSSHTRPTPRGGGLAIAITVLGGAVLLGVGGAVPVPLLAALVGGGTLIAAVGWIDDRRSLPVVARLVAHLAAATWAVAWLGGLPALSLGAGTLALGRLGAPLAILAIVWLTNLYNFMDGIDGLAGSEAVVVGTAAGLLLLASGHGGMAAVALLVAGAAAGFLGWNWPPARIFMGDVSSGLLGFVFATLAVGSENASALPALLWVLLLGAFVVDATATLLRRMARRERWYESHRSHAYQVAVQAGYSHRQVTGAVLAINLGLAALAWVGWYWLSLLLPLLAGSVASLLWIWGRIVRRSNGRSG